jgi:hypothetical protein
MPPVLRIAAAVTLVMLGRFYRELEVVLPWILGSRYHKHRVADTMAPF